MRAWILLGVGLALSVGGCGLGSDSTWGEERRSTWQIDDGLCPGAEGGCAMTTPVAAGVELSIDADVPCAVPRRTSTGERVADCDLMALDVVASGPVETRDVAYDVNDGRIDIRLFTVEPGEVSIELSDPDLFDRITFEVREAVDLECGRVGTRGASWDMPGLRTEGSYAVSTTGADRETNVELGCRLLDASGSPLFSAAAIEWQIVEGADLANVDDGGLFGGDSSTGARVYVRLDGTGTIRLEARFGDMTRPIEIVVR